MSAEYRPCDGRTVICQTLAKRLGDGRSKGLNRQHVINLRSLEDLPDLLLYRNSRSERGVALNFCPFCGKELNLEYRKIASSAPDIPSECAESDQASAALIAARRGDSR